MRLASPSGFAAVGLAWGVVAWLLGREAFGSAIWAGIAASPLVGALVGLATNHRFAQASFVWRTAWALLSLYLGAALFGLAIGLYEAAGGGRGVESLVESLIAVLYGTSLFVIALWPLAYVTHLALASDVAWWRRP